MTFSKLTQVCQKIIDLGEKALSRPWEAYYVFGSSDLPDCIESSAKDSNGKILEVCSVQDWYTEENKPTHNFRFIVSSANNAEHLAKACLIMQGALERIEYFLGDGDNGPSQFMSEPYYSAATALQKVEEIFK